MDKASDGKKVKAEGKDIGDQGKISYENEIIADILGKKELGALDEDFIVKKLGAFFADIHDYQYKGKVLEKLSNSKSYKQFSKSKEHDYLIKGVRTELRKVYGAFILEDYGRKYKILEKLHKGMDAGEEMRVHLELLELHKSTKERMTHYTALYNMIFSDIKAQELIILDLACGLNPLSNIFFRERIKKYYASDISSEDCKFLEAYFKKTGLEASVFPMDLADEKNYSQLTKVSSDVCFIFKTLDGLERVQRNITGKLLSAIDTRYFAITFPTLTLSGHREIKENRRLWLERLLDDLGWGWKKKLIENELLYLVKKGK